MSTSKEIYELLLNMFQQSYLSHWSIHRETTNAISDLLEDNNYYICLKFAENTHSVVQLYCRKPDSIMEYDLLTILDENPELLIDIQRVILENI